MTVEINSNRLSRQQCYYQQGRSTVTKHQAGTKQ